MEVHHPHHPNHKKKWSEYILEFLMLFLAVTLGFYAENVREHSIERHREREFISSMVNDLRTDTAKLGQNIRQFEKMKIKHDTLLNTFYDLDKGFSAKFYRNRNAITGFPDFIQTDATMQQLKNSGGFRLIKSVAAIDSIMAYDTEVKTALINQAGEELAFHNLNDRQVSLFNRYGLTQQLEQGKKPAQLEAEGFDYLISHDPEKLSLFYNRLHHFAWLSTIVKGNMTDVKVRATGLMAFLQKEYELETQAH